MPLSLAFQTKSLRDLCEKRELVDGKLGGTVAHALRVRLLDLRAATAVSDLIATGVVQPQRRVDQRLDLVDGFQLIFRANQKVIPTAPSGGTDWSKVHRIKLMKIEGPDV